MLQILLVDNKTVQPSLEQMLETSGLAAELVKATDLSTATRQLETSYFDCLLLDVSNVEDASMQLLHELQSYKNAVPILIITDCADLLTIQQWLAAKIWVLQRETLTQHLLAQMLTAITRTHTAEHRAAVMAQRIRQTDQLLLQQHQTIEANEKQIRQLHSQLSEVSQLKNQFLATVSHELRTPMNAIIGFSQLLLRQGQFSLSNRQSKLVERILSNAKHLLDAIDTILTFSKINIGELKLKPQPFNLVHLIQGVADELQPTAEQKHLTLKRQINLSNPEVVVDPTYLQQVIHNLLVNAIKFTPSGSVSVEVAELDADRVSISIRDTGIGIEAAQLETIFEPFRQVDQSITRQHRGMGMGLAVTAALVQQMQGSLVVKSQVGEGSVFRVELPRQASAAVKTQMPIVIGVTKDKAQVSSASFNYV